MSIDSLTNAAAARRPDMAPQGRIPRNYSELATASSTPPTTGETPDTDAAGSAQISTALKLLFDYIPTEVLTLYVAVVAALSTPDGPAQWGLTAWWMFVVATPLVVWLVFAAKVKAAGKSIPALPSSWPLWEMAAATVAFMAWTFALPDGPFAEFGWYSAALAGVGVLVASTMLGLIAPLFQTPLSTSGV